MKNDLQVVCSLLWLHASRAEPGAARDLFKAGEQRVHSIALLHQKLAESTQPGSVNLVRYAEGLAAATMKARVTALPITVDVTGHGVLLPVEQAVPCGLILNELLTNAQKHAFPHGYAQDAKVSVEIHRSDHRIEVIVADNGVGLPVRRKPPKNEGLGAQLVRMLTDQLDGTMQVTGNGGTRCVLSFPSLLAEDRAR